MKISAAFLFIGICAFLYACAPSPESPPVTSETIDTVATPINYGNQLKVGFLMVDGVYNSELMAPFDIFHHTIFHTDPSMAVFTVAPTHEAITSFEGIRIIPDYAFNDAPAIDVLVVPSAEHSMDTDLENEAMMRFVAEKGKEAQYLLSLCDGAFVLAKAGLLDSLESTTFPGDITAYREMFPHLTVHEKVSFVHHGKAITSAGGAKSYDPAMYLVELLYGKKVAEGVGRGMVIDWQLDSIAHTIVP